MRRYRWLVDALLGLALAVTGAVELWQQPKAASFAGPIWANAVALVALAAAVTVRSRWPLGALLVLAPTLVTWQLLWYLHAKQPPIEPFFATLLVVYAVSLHTQNRRRQLAIAVLLVAHAAVDVPALVAGRSPGDVFPAWVFALLAWFLGRAVQFRQRLADAEAERAERVERDSAAEAGRAVEAERARIARELHDVITHTVSGIVVQAAVEGRSLSGGPTKDVLLGIETAGREALVELRRLLGVLRHHDNELALAPQPGLAQLDALVRASELPVSLRLDGLGQALPVGVDLSAYRVVQEALTNVRKHATGVARVDVRVRHLDDELEIEVRDDGRPRANGTTPGYGLVGLRERVALHDGQLQAGPVNPHGYRLWVRLPLPTEPVR